MGSSSHIARLWVVIVWQCGLNLRGRRRREKQTKAKGVINAVGGRLRSVTPLPVWGATTAAAASPYCDQIGAQWVLISGRTQKKYIGIFYLIKTFSIFETFKTPFIYNLIVFWIIWKLLLYGSTNLFARKTKYALLKSIFYKNLLENPYHTKKFASTDPWFCAGTLCCHIKVKYYQFSFEHEIHHNFDNFL